MRRRNLAWDYAWTATEPAADGTVRVEPQENCADSIESRDIPAEAPTPGGEFRLPAGSRRREQYALQN